MKGHENKSLYTIFGILFALTGLLLGVSIIGMDIKTSKSTKSTLILIDSTDNGDSTSYTVLFKKTTSKDSILIAEKNIPEGSIVKTINRDLFLNLNPRFALWMICFSILISFSLGFFLPVIEIILELKKYLKLNFWYLSGAIAGAIALVVLANFVAAGNELIPYNKGDLIYPYAKILSDFEILLSTPKRTLNILIGLASVGPFVSVVGLFLIIAGLNKLQLVLNGIDRIDTKDTYGFYYSFKHVQELSNKLLLVLAITISGTIVTATLLRASILDSLSSHISFIFPVEHIYLYGLTYTAFVVIIFAPVYFQLKKLGYEALNKKDFIKCVPDKEKEMVMKNLKLQGGSINTIQIIFSVMAPALTSFVTNFLI